MRGSLCALCALALVLGACAAVEPNEVSLAACTDPSNEDEDGDGLINCDDPDCFGFVACSLAGRLLLDGGVRGPDPLDAGHGMGGRGGTGGTVSMPNSDGGTVNGPVGTDAGDTDAEASPCGVCASDEVCTDAGCAAIDDEYGLYKLTISSATVPATTAATRCYDNPCEIGAIPYGVCTCSPDPYVRVFLVPASDPNGPGTKVGETAVVKESGAPAFAALDILVDLQPGDSLRFEVWDDDAPFPDEKMYECVPDLESALGAISTIECSAMTGVGNLETHSVHATLSPATE